MNSLLELGVTNGGPPPNEKVGNALKDEVGKMSNELEAGRPMVALGSALEGKLEGPPGPLDAAMDVNDVDELERVKEEKLDEMNEGLTEEELEDRIDVGKDTETLGAEEDDEGPSGTRGELTVAEGTVLRADDVRGIEKLSLKGAYVEKGLLLFELGKGEKDGMPGSVEEPLLADRDNPNWSRLAAESDALGLAVRELEIVELEILGTLRLEDPSPTALVAEGFTLDMSPPALGTDVIRLDESDEVEEGALVIPETPPVELGSAPLDHADHPELPDDPGRAQDREVELETPPKDDGPKAELREPQMPGELALEEDAQEELPWAMLEAGEAERD